MSLSRRGIVIAAMAAVVLAGAAFVVVDRFGSGVDDPVTAQCPRPPVTVRAERQRPDHLEIDVRFTCQDAAQAATIYLPPGPGRHPGVVWVHGAGPATRLGWGGPIVPGLVRAGVAVLSYDKRGVGGSQGVCCPGDLGHFNLLTADVVGAVSALRAGPGIDPGRVGLIGASQAGWIAPRAAVETRAAFVALASAPAVPERIANLYQRLAGGEDGRLSRQEISRRLRHAHPTGFDPLPYLRQMMMPSLWLFGTADDKTPVEESQAVLTSLQAGGHDITIRVFPGAGHGLLDNPPTAPEAAPTMINWILAHLAATT